MPAEYLTGNTLVFKPGGKLAPDELRRQCTFAERYAEKFDKPLGLRRIPLAIGRGRTIQE